MVFKGSLYVLNLLCGIIPCEHKFSLPDTSISDSVAYRDRVNVDFDAELDANSIEWKEDGEGEGEDDELLLSNEIDYNKTHPLIVHTSTGTLQGYWMRAVGGHKIRAFEGIPYAEPPMNDRRFQAPVSKTPWIGVLPATLKGPKCLQYNQIALSRVIGSENCLYLNIYTPKPSRNKTSSRKFPVLIYIHGGSYLTGSGSDWGPVYLLQKSLILVTINYRLGVMGFMSTVDPASPGNYGLKDQAKAIDWIHNNIANFSGDPEKITLVGHGAGGSSAHFQMMSYYAKGKFKAVIAISGNAFNPWAMHTKDQALNLTQTFAKAMQCPIHGKTADMVTCLRKQRGADLVKKQIAFLDNWPVPLSLFRPVIEAEYQTEDPFFTETPEEAYQKGSVERVPLICGQEENEGYTFLLSHVALGTFTLLRQKWNTLAADFFNYNDLPVDQEEILRRVNLLYFHNVSAATAPPKIYSEALGARLIYTANHKALQAHSQYAETYAFMFGYKGKYNLGEVAGIKQRDWAVGHGEILGYLLNSTDMYPGLQRNDSELVLSKILVNLLHNFANDKTPGFTTEDGDTFHIWNPITDPLNMSFLHIDKKIKMISEPYLQQILYWESFGIPDSLPLGNFTHEIENITADWNSTGFVSTYVTKTGTSLPRDLRPPPPPHLVRNNALPVYNHTEEPPKNLPVSSTTLAPDTSSTTDTTSNSNCTNPIASVSNCSIATNGTVSRDQPPPPPPPQFPTPPSTTSVTKSASSYLPTTTSSPPPQYSDTTENPNKPGENIFYNLYAFESSRNGTHDQSDKFLPGISIPILSGNNPPNFKFVTKSNITLRNLTQILGIDMPEPHMIPIQITNTSNPDETLITASNVQHRMYRGSS